MTSRLIADIFEDFGNEPVLENIKSFLIDTENVEPRIFKFEYIEPIEKRSCNHVSIAK